MSPVARNRKKHPEEGLRGALGILRLAQDYSSDKLIAACESALRFGVFGYRNVKAFITAPTPTDSGNVRQLPLLHDNVRGPHYYQPTGDSHVD